MKVTETKLKGAYLVSPDTHIDERGTFREVYHHERYKEFIPKLPEFVQDNVSTSKRGVLRGLHYQKTRPQAKLVQCLVGEIFDVIVDVRVRSETYGKWQSFTLSEENRTQLYVPPGFAHGFQVLSEYSICHYKCSAYYDPSDEACLKWDDSYLSIAWPLEDLVVSTKDRLGTGLPCLEAK